MSVLKNKNKEPITNAYQFRILSFTKLVLRQT